MSYNNIWFFLSVQDVYLNLLKALERPIWELVGKCYGFEKSFKALICGRIFLKACIQVVSGSVFLLVPIRQKWDVTKFGFSLLLCTTQRYKLKKDIALSWVDLEIPQTMTLNNVVCILCPWEWQAPLRWVMKDFEFKGLQICRYIIK